MESCIFCLDDNPPTYIYNGICNCRPSIHADCINEWYNINPNTCPICLIKPFNITNINRMKLCIFLCIISICWMFLFPMFLIWLVLRLHLLDTVHHHHHHYHNTTIIT